MSKQYYLDNMEAVMTDSGYDVRLTYFFLGAILKAARTDYSLSRREHLDIECEYVYNQRNLIRMNPDFQPVITGRSL